MCRRGELLARASNVRQNIEVPVMKSNRLILAALVGGIACGLTVIVGWAVLREPWRDPVTGETRSDIRSRLDREREDGISVGSAIAQQGRRLEEEARKRGEKIHDNERR
jgi:hypothetical protein